MLTKDILFGMNVLSLGGFLVMGLSLTLHRTGNVGVPLSIGLMCVGTALVFFGLFAVSSSNQPRQARLFVGNHIDHGPRRLGGKDEISIRTANTATWL